MSNSSRMYRVSCIVCVCVRVCVYVTKYIENIWCATQSFIALKNVIQKPFYENCIIPVCLHLCHSFCSQIRDEDSNVSLCVYVFFFNFIIFIVRKHSNARNYYFRIRAQFWLVRIHQNESLCVWYGIRMEYSIVQSISQVTTENDVKWMKRKTEETTLITE